ncbi:uncharacterized protein LOC130520739 isoform X2 [Takifugu flavidus]|uniref:uncharacterized protein LOC130520739 isoform X2 n=1 Tax=Takifugu flavidus TaxID=433684 RepID=UPI0025442662|nr:uncharacterized protein LOC130520739 isoform X2 [Takifugu flavidus]
MSKNLCFPKPHRCISHPAKRPSLFLVTWKKFYVHLAGCTGGAHLHIVDLLKQLNQSEVFSPEESDYIVVFCPVRSHIRTDISVALETVPALKPTILVVLHHTFDPNSVEADSKRQVCNRLPDLLLTVDCLFNEGKLLSSKHNKAAYMEIIKLIATSYQGYANKIHVCSSPQKVPAPELCVSFTPVLHQLVIRGRGGLICCAGCLHTCS